MTTALATARSETQLLLLLSRVLVHLHPEEAVSEGADSGVTVLPVVKHQAGPLSPLSPPDVEISGHQPAGCKKL